MHVFDIVVLSSDAFHYGWFKDSDPLLGICLVGRTSFSVIR